MSTFVSVGTSHNPFRRLLDAVGDIAHLLPQPVIVQHGHTPFSHPGCQSIAFLGGTEFEQAITAAELVIVQAGGGGVLHALRSHKLPVIVPRRAEHKEIIDDHQVPWAQALAGTGRAILVEDPSDISAFKTAIDFARSNQSSGKQILTRPLLIELTRRALIAGSAVEREPSRYSSDRKNK